jgi:hypothetical protein
VARSAGASRRAEGREAADDAAGARGAEGDVGRAHAAAAAATGGAAHGAREEDEGGVPALTLTVIRLCGNRARRVQQHKSN